ncbi:MAG: hypothetical protein QOI50_5869 [Pseudonocardiales bacterium]|nr:hypothetical protein [Pseudonocardiales bacterium]
MILAHGIGGRADLPLPGELVLQAGGFVVLVSFLAVGLTWRRSRFHTAVPGRPLPAAVQRLADSDRVRLGLRCLMLALLAYLLVQAFGGVPDPNHNPAPRALYVLLWVGMVPASLVFGPVWRVLNPLRALHRGLSTVLRLPPAGYRELPPALGYWPAALGLTVFVWLELVPGARADPPVVGGFMAGYAVLITAGALRYGPSWFDRADPFEAYSSLVAALSPVGRAGYPGNHHEVELRNPFRGLNAVRPAPGLVAVLAVWWGSTVFDGVSGTPWWATTSQVAAAASGIPVELIATGVLAALIALVAASYRLATGALARELVSTLIPIAVGYTIAHYASLLLVEGPRGLAQLADPSAPALRGAPAPLLIAVIQVAAILVGHVVGVIAAHDRVVALNPTARTPADTGTAADAGSARTPAAASIDSSALTESRRLADQVPLVLLMIVYTMIGLYLLVIA